MDKFFRFAQMSGEEGCRLDITGTIVPQRPWWDENSGRYCASAEFQRQLAACDGQKLTVVIDSDGGDAGAGIGMYEALRQRRGETHAVVIKAYSAATLPLAGCDKGRRSISPAGSIMIHRPKCSASGDRSEMQAADNFLRVIEEATLSAYAAASGKAREELAQLMAAETFWTAQEAITNGFADAILPPKQLATMCGPQLSSCVAASNEATGNMIRAALAADEDTTKERAEILRYLESVGRRG